MGVPVVGFSVPTRCRTVEEFVDLFKTVTDDESIVFENKESCAIGSPCAFAILLADRKTVFAGMGIVLEELADANNRFGRKGVRVRITRLRGDSARVFAELHAARRGIALALPRRRVLTVTIPPLDEPIRSARRTLPIGIPLDVSSGVPELPRFDDPTPPKVHAKGSCDTLVGPPPPPEVRVPSASEVVPANPLMNLTDAALQGLVECRLFEGSSAALAKDSPVPDQIDGESTVPVPDGSARVEAIDVELANREPSPPPARWIGVAWLPAFALIGGTIGSGIGIAARRLLASHDEASVVGVGQLDEMQVDEPRAGAVELDIELRARVEAAPPAPPDPVVAMPIHAVYVQTSPIAARVTAGGRAFGTTPTYIKIPAFTPVELHIERPGFAPVTRMMTSKRKLERVFIRLKRSRR